MNMLFEECRIALGKDFQLIAKEKEEFIFKQLDEYLTCYGTVDWSKLTTHEYVEISALIQSNNLINGSDVYIVADTSDVPVFESKLNTVLNNFADVTALSCKVFIFNQSFIIQEQFPSSTIKVGLRYKYLVL